MSLTLRKVRAGDYERPSQRVLDGLSSEGRVDIPCRPNPMSHPHVRGACTAGYGQKTRRTGQQNCQSGRRRPGRPAAPHWRGLCSMDDGKRSYGLGGQPHAGPSPISPPSALPRREGFAMGKRNRESRGPQAGSSPCPKQIALYRRGNTDGPDVPRPFFRQE